MTHRIAALDVGSSTWKFAAFDLDDTALRPVVRETVDLRSASVEAALERFFATAATPAPAAIAHRIVFGGDAFTQPARATPQALGELEALVALDPLHLRPELDAVAAVTRRLPDSPQVLCFDTAFFAGMPAVATRLPLPPAPGLRRYGFHGLSYEYVAGQLPPDAGRTIVAHLGSGASLCAMTGGVPLDTTMGFTVLGGLMMGTRPGDLDPGVVLELLRRGFAPAQLEELLYRSSGLRGVSGSSADMRELLAAAPHDARARDAVELFVYVLTKHLGAMIAVLGGLDTLVFTGGIGENAAPIRSAACRALAYAGATVDEPGNERNAAVISQAGASATVRVIATDELVVAAGHAARLLGFAESSHPVDKMRP